MDNPENASLKDAIENPDPASRETEDLQDQDRGDAVLVNASKFVSEDTDRPVADNKNTPVSDRPDDPTSGEAEPAPTGKKRGRAALSEQEKLRRAALRADAKAKGIAPPDFSDINAGGRPATAGIGNVPLGQPARDYMKEALGIYVPVSFTIGKFFGEHWYPGFDKEKGTLKLTEEQIAYVQSLAEEIQYENWGPLNPRYKFLLHTVAYAAPRVKTAPTPEKFKNLWKSIKETVSGWFGKKRNKKKREEKEALENAAEK